MLVPGSLVFRQTRGPVSLDDYRNWWHWVPGAQWRHPEGPGSTLSGREQKILGIIETARAKRAKFRDERITMAHGAGGKATLALIEGLLAPAFE